MIDLCAGRVAISLAGRDKGRYVAVVGTESGFALVADGRLRSVGSPKKKNPKHLSLTKTVLSAEMMLSDSSLRKAIEEVFGSCGR